MMHKGYNNLNIENGILLALNYLKRVCLRCIINPVHQDANMHDRHRKSIKIEKVPRNVRSALSEKIISLGKRLGSTSRIYASSKWDRTRYPDG